jgi:hypothetical protein
VVVPLNRLGASRRHTPTPGSRRTSAVILSAIASPFTTSENSQYTESCNFGSPASATIAKRYMMRSSVQSARRRRSPTSPGGFPPLNDVCGRDRQTPPKPKCTSASTASNGLLRRRDGF